MHPLYRYAFHSPPHLLCLSLLFLCLFSCSLSSPVAAVSVVSFSPCDTSIDGALQSITWSTKDGDDAASIIDYRVCGRRSQDLRFVTHLHLVHWSNDQRLMDREFAICTGSSAKRQACLDQLAQSNYACLSGSIAVRLPVFVNSPDGRTRSEILIAEGPTATVMRFCSN
jgi:hypothetical protein